MDQVIEIDTLSGAVRCTNDALAQAAAELIATECRNETDLIEVLCLDLDATDGSLADFASPAS